MIRVLAIAIIVWLAILLAAVAIVPSVAPVIAWLFGGAR